MSVVENQVKPVLESLINGGPILVGAAQRRVLADWLIKTVMVIDARPEAVKPFFTKPEREAFKAAMVASVSEVAYPHRLRVWLAASVGIGPYTMPLPCFRKTLADDGTEATLPFYVFTFASGHAVLQLVAAHLPVGEDSARAFVSPLDHTFDRAALPIYPVVDPAIVVPWPPMQVLLEPEEHLDRFSTRWCVPVEDVVGVPPASGTGA